MICFGQGRKCSGSQRNWQSNECHLSGDLRIQTQSTRAGARVCWGSSRGTFDHVPLHFSDVPQSMAGWSLGLNPLGVDRVRPGGCPQTPKTWYKQAGQTFESGLLVIGLLSRRPSSSSPALGFEEVLVPVVARLGVAIALAHPRIRLPMLIPLQDTGWCRLSTAVCVRRIWRCRSLGRSSLPRIWDGDGCLA